MRTLKAGIAVLVLASSCILFGQSQPVSAEFPANEAALKKLPTTPLEGLLLDSSRHPLKGQVIELEFFPGCDNPDCILEHWIVASATTRSDGKFRFDVPLIPGKRQFLTQFVLSSNHSVLKSQNFEPPKLDIGAAKGGIGFDPQRVYLNSISVVLLSGSIKGRLGASFLKQNGLPLNLKSYLDYKGPSIALELIGRPGGKANVRPDADGKFGIQLPPGIYDLSVHIVRNSQPVDIIIQKGIVVVEGKTTVVEIP